MVSLPCPNDDELRHYCLGSLPAERIDRVADHVDDCGACSDRLTDLVVMTDPLADAVRRAGQVRAYAAVAAPTTLREYRLEEVLGEGGMGTVYRAVHTRLGRAVALKLLTAPRRLDPDAAARFEREMKAIGALRHPNIVHATDAGEIDGVPFLVMELLDGRDLGRLVQDLGPMELAAACEVVRQAALGLQHAHDFGLVHRDVKPSNVMVTAGGTVKLLDLGLARLAKGTEGENAGGETAIAGMSDLTDPHALVGTDRYMAPEQRSTPHRVGPAADIYALGRTLCYALHGSPELPQADRVPTALHSLLQQMQAEKPGERPASANAVAKALQTWCPGQAVKRWWIGPAVAAALVAGTAIAIALSGSKKEEVPTPEIELAPVARKTPPKAGQLDMSAEQAVALRQAWATFLEVEPFSPNDAGMRLALVPPGDVILPPVTNVRITKPYWLGVTEVTRGQFREFVARTGHRTTMEKLNNGSYHWSQPTKLSSGTRLRKDATLNWKSPGHPDPTDEEPVSQVSWHDAVSFCQYLSEREGKTYRLPTVAELSWAARAGNKATFAGGTPLLDDAQALEEYACTAWVSPKRPLTVAQLKPNAWGLYDTTGNVSEWASDWYGDLPGGTFEDHTGPKEGTMRVHYGDSYVSRGSFNSRMGLYPDWGNSKVGFRVLREP